MVQAVEPCWPCIYRNIPVPAHLKLYVQVRSGQVQTRNSALHSLGCGCTLLVHRDAFFHSTKAASNGFSLSRSMSHRATKETHEVRPRAASLRVTVVRPQLT